MGAYRIWCYKQGLDKGLDKDEKQLLQERGLFQRYQEMRRPAVGDGDLQPVLTISVDNRAKVIRDFRGRHNMLPNGKKRTHHKMERPYLHLLRDSPRIMKRWMEREQLQYWQDASYAEAED